MIDDKVNKLSQEFASTWNEALKDYPVYALDLTWPSVGTVDLITYSLRNKEELNEAEQRVIATASAYLAVLAHECWKQFPSKPFVEAKILGDEFPELTIQARNKAGDKNADLSVAVSSTLLEILQNPANPFPVYSDFKRPINSSENLISLFALGLLIGRCPYGEGKWLEQSDKDLADNIVSALGFMAETSAAYYERVFGAEALGIKPSLYLHELIFPPMLGAKEPVPLALAINGAKKFFANQNGLKIEDIQNCSLNLSRFPDSNISAAGIAISAATCNLKPSKTLLACCQSKGDAVANLKPAISLARAALSEPSDWCRDIVDGNLERAKNLFEYERTLGLSPVLTLSFESCLEPEHRELASILSWSHAIAAHKLIDESPNISLSHPDIWFQNCYLEFRIRGHKAALSALDKQPTNLSQTSHIYAKALELKAVCYLKENKVTQSEKLLRQSQDVDSSDIIKRQRVNNHLAWCLILQEKIADALAIVEKTMEDKRFSLAAHINAVQLYRLTKQNSKARQTLNQLVELVPHDRKVFHHCLGLSSESNN